MYKWPNRNIKPQVFLLPRYRGYYLWALWRKSQILYQSFDKCICQIIQCQSQSF